MLTRNILKIGFKLKKSHKINEDQNISEAMLYLLKRLKRTGHTIYLVSNKHKVHTNWINHIKDPGKYIDKYISEKEVQKLDLLISRKGIYVYPERKQIKVRSIAIDVQGTLTGPDSNTIINFIKILKRMGLYIIIWTAGDKSDANYIVKALKLEKFVDETRSKLDEKELPDITFDDDKFALFLGKYATIRI